MKSSNINANSFRERSKVWRRKPRNSLINQRRIRRIKLKLSLLLKIWYRRKLIPKISLRISLRRTQSFSLILSVMKRSYKHSTSKRLYSSKPTRTRLPIVKKFKQFVGLWAVLVKATLFWTSKTIPWLAKFTTTRTRRSQRRNDYKL
jgi:hypothetical protein